MNYWEHGNAHTGSINTTNFFRSLSTINFKEDIYREKNWELQKVVGSHVLFVITSLKTDGLFGNIHSACLY
jgi:hypothetical protein